MIHTGEQGIMWHSAMVAWSVLQAVCYTPARQTSMLHVCHLFNSTYIGSRGSKVQVYLDEARSAGRLVNRYPRGTNSNIPVCWGWVLSLGQLGLRLTAHSWKLQIAEVDEWRSCGEVEAWRWPNQIRLPHRMPSLAVFVSLPPSTKGQTC